MLCRCYGKDGCVYLCGNGGSASDAEHIVGELMKSFLVQRPLSDDMERCLGDPALSGKLQESLRAFSLTGSGSLASAFANDVDPGLVYAQQIYGYGRPGDVLWGISTSGRSENVLRALQVARAKGLDTLGLTGRDGGGMASLCKVCIRVPETETYKVQELHLPVYHALCAMLEAHFFKD